MGCSLGTTTHRPTTLSRLLLLLGLRLALLPLMLLVPCCTSWLMARLLQVTPRGAGSSWCRCCCR